MNTSKKAKRTKELIGKCLDCFIEKGLTATTTKDLCDANNLQNGGIYNGNIFKYKYYTS